MSFFNKIKSILFRSSENEITYLEAKEIIRQYPDTVLLDVRSNQEFDEGHLDGAISISVYDLATRINSIVKNRDNIIIVYCQTGRRSKKAEKILTDLCYSNIYIIKNALDK